MAPNTDHLSRLFGKKPDPAPELPQPEAELVEAGDPRVGAKPQLAVTFVDAAGRPWQFAYSHLYRQYVEGGALVVEFTGHKVVVEGTRLFAPAKDCLMRRLGQHKVEFVEATPRAEFDAAGVTAVRVEELKAG